MTHVLVVEDNLLNLELFVDLLTVAGHEVRSCSDAETGIEMARAAPPALILMDIGLPGMDGLQATRLLRQDDRTSRIPIVAVTAHAMKEDEERVMAAGCDGYITKPVNTRTFVIELEERFLQSPSAHRPFALPAQPRTPR